MKNSNTEKTIFAGTKAFDVIKNGLGVIYGCNEIRHGDVKFVRSELAEPNSIFTEDPSLVEVLEALKQKFE